MNKTILQYTNIDDREILKRVSESAENENSTKNLISDLKDTLSNIKNGAGYGFRYCYEDINDNPKTKGDALVRGNKFSVSIRLAALALIAIPIASAPMALNVAFNMKLFLFNMS